MSNFHIYLWICFRIWPCMPFFSWPEICHDYYWYLYHLIPWVVPCLFFLYWCWCVFCELAGWTKGGHLDKTDRFKKLSRWNVQPAQSNQGKEMELMNKAVNDEICSPRPLVHGGKRGKTVPTSIITADKVHQFFLWESVAVYEMAVFLEATSNKYFWV